MAPRWIGTRCRPIDISDAVGYLIGCVRTRGRQVGNSTSRPSRKEQPAEGVANCSPTDCVQSFPRHAMSSAAPTRETVLKNSPPRGWRNWCSPGRLFLSFP